MQSQSFENDGRATAKMGEAEICDRVDNAVIILSRALWLLLQSKDTYNIRKLFSSKYIFTAATWLERLQTILWYYVDEIPAQCRLFSEFNKSECQRPGSLDAERKSIIRSRRGSRSKITTASSNTLVSTGLILYARCFSSYFGLWVNNRTLGV